MPKKTKTTANNDNNTDTNNEIIFRSYSSSYSNVNGDVSEYSRDVKYANGEGYITTNKDGNISTKKMTKADLKNLSILSFQPLPLQPLPPLIPLIPLTPSKLPLHKKDKVKKIRQE
jgi:hypothetical protein